MEQTGVHPARGESVQHHERLFPVPIGPRLLTDGQGSAKAAARGSPGEERAKRSGSGPVWGQGEETVPTIW